MTFPEVDLTKVWQHGATKNGPYNKVDITSVGLTSGRHCVKSHPSLHSTCHFVEAFKQEGVGHGGFGICIVREKV